MGQRFARTLNKGLNNVGVFHSLQFPMNYSIAMAVNLPSHLRVFWQLHLQTSSTVAWICRHTEPRLYVL
jgi:hypothetical protein